MALLIMGAAFVAPLAPAAGDVDSTRAPAGFAPEAIAPTGPSAVPTATKDWLVIQDNVPWLFDSVVDALNAGGYTFDKITSTQFPPQNLLDYRGIIVTGDQQNSLHNNLANKRAVLAAYVLAGGTLVVNYAQNGHHSNPVIATRWVPGCLGFTIAFSNDLHILDPADPITVGLDDADLFNWNFSSHGFLRSLPADHKVIIEGVGGFGPTFVSYPFGLGTVYATMQTVEWGYDHAGVAFGIPLDGAKLLQNELTVPHDPADGWANVASPDSWSCYLFNQL